MLRSVLMFIAAMSFVPALAQSQQLHPKKRAFGNLPKWSTTSPGGSTRLKNFKPFRAVYDRKYKQGLGANAGAVREDRVIISAENVGWEGKDAVAITLIDSGIVQHSDTNARASTSIVNKANLAVLFEISPVPGTAKDYFIARVDPTVIRASQISTDSQKLTPRTMNTSKPGFGPTAWAMASMKLRTGLKMKFGPTLGGGSPLTSAEYGRVLRRGTFKDSAGNSFRSWVIETTRNPTSPKVHHIHVVNKPPYYLGTESVNLDTDERTRFIWLRSFRSFDKAAAPDAAAKTDSAKAGRVAFTTGMCMKCHGENGQGTKLGPNLTDSKWVHCDGSVAGIRKVLDSGVPKNKLSSQNFRFGMNPATNLIKNSAELDALARYVASLSRE